MIIEPNIQVPNTFALPAVATMGCIVQSTAEVSEALVAAHNANLPFCVVGQGSNIIPQARVEQFVCIMHVRGIEVIEDNQNEVRIHVAAGESWHELVRHSVARGWFGLENLALIPGRVGAAPVQNIGAYGVELAQFVESVDVINPSGMKEKLSAQDCQFGYRDSVFKTRRDLTIVGVTLRLGKTPEVNVDYPELGAELAAQHIQSATPAQVLDAVVAVRQRKLPDPSVVPNVGSFFKNPVVTPEQVEQLARKHPHLKQYSQGEFVKLSAAQLIDLAGGKQKQQADVACWQHQPLVLVNSGQASTGDVLAFADEIRQDVLTLFAVQLELEPSVLS